MSLAVKRDKRLKIVVSCEPVLDQSLARVFWNYSGGGELVMG